MFLCTLRRVRAIVKDQFKAYNKRKGRELAKWSELKDRDDIHTVKELLPRAVFGVRCCISFSFIEEETLTCDPFLFVCHKPVMPGDSYSSRRLFSLLFAGTIPVLICDLCMLPYQDILDYTKFVLFLPEERLLRSDDDTDMKFDIFDVLEAVSTERIAAYQEQGRRVRRHFVYHDGKPEPGDAFDLMVRA